MAESLTHSTASVRRSGIRVAVMGIMAGLPWIDRTNFPTILLCALGVYVFIMAVKKGRQDFPVGLQPLSALFLLYFGAYLLAWAVYPGDPSVRYAIQQKSAFALVPFLLYYLQSADKKLWPYARTGFIGGTAAALVACIASAALAYRQTGDSSVFFYHDLVKVLHANAIYTSLSILITIAFLINYLSNATPLSVRRRVLIGLLLVFLFLGLLLLSSKILIVTGAALILFYIYRRARPGLQRLCLLLTLAAVMTGIFATRNPINERFAVVAWQQPDLALKYSDYSAATLDGLSLRVLLWRMGVELLQERGAWLTGLGGKHYHQFLNEKIAAYKLYEGYQNIDLHNQYMEFLVGFGIGALLLWIAVLGYAASRAIRERRALLGTLVAVFSIAFLTESVLETQAGILIFTVIISGEWIQRQYS